MIGFAEAGAAWRHGLPQRWAGATPPMHHLSHPALLPALTGLLLAACAQPPHGLPSVACGGLAGTLSASPALAQFQPRVDSARKLDVDDQGHPAHCLVQGRLNERSGAGGRRHAIHFEMRLPQTWNQRLLFQAGGEGTTPDPAWGRLAVQATDALSTGFAVISGLAGPEPAALADAGLAQASAWGLDAQARRDRGHAAIPALQAVAMALATAHYGRPPQQRYIAGCGDGGRQALVAASRYPALFDGLLAGAPGLGAPQAAIQHAWDMQQWLKVNADIRQAFSPADMRLVARQVLARCDGLDLLVDGVVADLPRCQKALRRSDFDALACIGAKQTGCLSGPQLRALQQSFAGPHDSAGQALYSDWAWDSGIAAAGWRHWKLQSDMPAWAQMPALANLGSAALAQAYTTPPTPVAGKPSSLREHVLHFDFDRDASKVLASGPPFTESALALMDPPDAADPQLAGLAKSGGKLLVFHGASDPRYSVQRTLRWAEQLQAKVGLAPADARARLFVVPGMGHCGGGPATDRFDALGALVDWVEKAQPPQQLPAQVDAKNPELPADWSRSRSRLLCPWPQVARYRGGEVESAKSFRCAAP